MTHDDTMIPLPDPCARAMRALEADALHPGAEAEAHLRGCAACAEARIMLLAQEDAPLPLVPAGYFEALPPRLARKLPAAKAPRRPLPAWIWGAAAGVLMAAGLGGYLAGRATPALPVLQPVAQQSTPAEAGADRTLPFHDRDEDLAELGSLSPGEMRDLVSTLDAAPAKPHGGRK